MKIGLKNFLFPLGRNQNDVESYEVSLSNIHIYEWLQKAKISDFSSFYRGYLTKEDQLDESAKELLSHLNFPLPENEVKDFLRVLGVVCDQVFVGPKRILFDLSYGCNLDCVYCRRHSPINPHHQTSDLLSEKKRKLKFLSLERIENTLLECKELGVEEVLLVGGGEPTIHPDFFEIVRSVKSKGMGLNFSTNGLLLKPELCDLLVEQKVDNITVSVSGASFESYKKTHPKMTKDGFDRLFRGFEYLNCLRRKRTQKDGVEYAKPFMIFLHVLTNQNYHEIYDMVFAGKEYGFDTVWFKLIHPSSWSRHLCLNRVQADFVRNAIRELRDQKLEICIDEYLDAELSHLDDRGDWSHWFHQKRRCLVGWNFSYMDLSGDLSFCCGDKIIFKKKSTDSFLKNWKSRVYANYRQSARDINYGGRNLKTKNSGLLIDDFCKSCDNTNFNQEMESLIRKYGLDQLSWWGV